MSAAEHIQIPEKLFYRINEVSTITQVKPYVLRYWETEFPMLTPEKDENDQRRYRKNEIELILEIKNLLYTEKYTIAGARKQLQRGKSEPAAPQPVAVNSDPQGGVSREKARYLAGALGQLRQDVDELYRLLA